MHWKIPCIFQIWTLVVFIGLAPSIPACAPKSDPDRCENKNFATQSTIGPNSQAQSVKPTAQSIKPTAQPIKPTVQSIKPTVQPIIIKLGNETDRQLNNARDAYNAATEATRRLQFMGSQVNDTRRLFNEATNNIFKLVIEQPANATSQTVSTSIKLLTNTTQLWYPTVESITESISFMYDVVQLFNKATFPQKTEVIRAINESVQNITRTLNSLTDLKLQLDKNVSPLKVAQPVTTMVKVVNNTYYEFLLPTNQFLGAIVQLVRPTGMRLEESIKLLDSVGGFSTSKGLIKDFEDKIDWNEFV